MNNEEVNKLIEKLLSKSNKELTVPNKLTIPNPKLPANRVRAVTVNALNKESLKSVDNHKIILLSWT